MKVVQEPKKLQKTLLTPSQSDLLQEREGTRSQEAQRELAVSNRDLVGALSASVAGRKDLYDEVEPSTFTRIDTSFKDGLKGYRPSVKEEQEGKIPRQFLNLSTTKGNFSVGKSRGKRELIMTSSIENARGQSVTNNAQRKIDASHKSFYRGRVNVLRSNTPVKDEALVISSEERVFNAGRLSKKITDRMSREKRMDSLVKTVPFLNKEKESLSILTLRERLRRLQERQKLLDANRKGDGMTGNSMLERSVFNEKQTVEDKLAKCQAVLTTKEQMHNRFMKSFTKAVKSANDETIDTQLEEQKTAWKAIYQNEEFDDQDEDEEDRGIRKTGKTKKNNRTSRRKNQV